MLKREEYLLCYNRLLLSEALGETAQWLISQMVWYETVIREMIERKANGQWK